jgi:hypothetical protein
MNNDAGAASSLFCRPDYSLNTAAYEKTNVFTFSGSVRFIRTGSHLNKHQFHYCGAKPQMLKTADPAAAWVRLTHCLKY